MADDDRALCESGGTMLETLGQMLEDGVCAYGWEDGTQCLEDPEIDIQDYCVLCSLRAAIEYERRGGYEMSETHWLETAVDDTLDGLKAQIEALRIQLEDERDQTALEMETDIAREWVQIRPEVRAFAQSMEEVLRKNDHKGGWHNMSFAELVGCIAKENAELVRAFNSHPTANYWRDICHEAVDIANFAMMIFCNAAKGGGIP